MLMRKYGLSAIMAHKHSIASIDQLMLCKDEAARRLLLFGFGANRPGRKVKPARALETSLNKAKVS